MLKDYISQSELLCTLKDADKALTLSEILQQCRPHVHSNAEQRQKAIARLRSALGYYAAKGCVTLTIDEYSALRYSFRQFPGYRGQRKSP